MLQTAKAIGQHSAIRAPAGYSIRCPARGLPRPPRTAARLASSATRYKQQPG